VYASMLCLVASLGLLLGDSAAGGTRDSGPIAIIVHRENPVSDIAVEDVRHLYLGVRIAFPNGQPVLLLESTALRERFYHAALGMTVDEVRRYWIGLLFAGDPAAPPQQVADDVTLKLLVRRHRGAVAYIRASHADTTVKVLQIHGASPGDPDYPVR
jgi:hypothetical protein